MHDYNGLRVLYRSCEIHDPRARYQGGARLVMHIENAIENHQAEKLIIMSNVRFVTPGCGSQDRE